MITNHDDRNNILDDDLRSIATSPTGSVARHLHDEESKVH